MKTLEELTDSEIGTIGWSLFDGDDVLAELEQRINKMPKKIDTVIEKGFMKYVSPNDIKEPETIVPLQAQESVMPKYYKELGELVKIYGVQFKMQIYVKLGNGFNFMNLAAHYDLMNVIYSSFKNKENLTYSEITAEYGPRLNQKEKEHILRHTKVKSFNMPVLLEIEEITVNKIKTKKFGEFNLTYELPLESLYHKTKDGSVKFKSLYFIKYNNTFRFAI